MKLSVLAVLKNNDASNLCQSSQLGTEIAYLGKLISSVISTGLTFERVCSYIVSSRTQGKQVKFTLVQTNVIKYIQDKCY